MPQKPPRPRLDALDGSPRVEVPPMSWRNQLLRNATQMLVAMHMTRQAEIVPHKIRKLADSFISEVEQLERNVVKEGEEVTWEHCRRISLGLARLFKAHAEDILEI